MKSSWGGALLRVAISLVAIGLLIYLLRHDLESAVGILQNEVRWQWFAIAALTYLVAISILAVRLLFVFRVQDIQMTFKEVYYLTLVGLFFNAFLPSAVGGDFAKAYYAYKHSGKKMAATTSVLLDRLMGFVALLLMSLGALLLFGQELDEPKIQRSIFVLIGIMITILLFFGSKRIAKRFKFIHDSVPSAKWRDRLSNVYHAVYGYKRHRRVLVLLVLLSFVGQAFFILVHYCMARGLNAKIPAPIFFMLVPLASIISMVPSIGGLGVREAGLIYLFKRFMPTERALAFSVLLDVLSYGFSLFCGILYALRGGLKAKEVIHEMEESDDR